jgi:hypothetical protein
MRDFGNFGIAVCLLAILSAGPSFPSPQRSLTSLPAAAGQCGSRCIVPGRFQVEFAALIRRSCRQGIPGREAVIDTAGAKLPSRFLDCGASELVHAARRSVYQGSTDGGTVVLALAWPPPWSVGGARRGAAPGPATGSDPEEDKALALLKRLDPSLTERNPRKLSDVTAARLSAGSVTDEQLECIAGATRLVDLSLAGTAITGKGLRRIAHLRLIRFLNLTGTKVSDDDLRVLSCLGGLTSLILDGTAIGGRGARWLERCGQLRFLSISDTAMTDLDLGSLAGCRWLEQVRAERSRLDGSFLRICERLPRLGTISLNGSRNFVGATLAHLENHPALMCLGLTGTPVDDKDVKHLTRIPRLKLLWLSRTKVTDRAMSVIASVNSLDSLGLTETQITDTGLMELREARSLKRLFIDGTGVTDEGIQQLKWSLKDLDLNLGLLPLPVDN